MEPRTITESRLKVAGYLAICLAFVAGSVALSGDPRQSGAAWVSWLGGGFFGLGVLVFSWMLIRPQVLRLDLEGFTLDGGLVRKPRRIPWRDVERFYVFRLPRGGKMVGFDYAPGRAPKTPLIGFSRAMGAEGGLPKGWPMSPEALVELLTEYQANGGSRAAASAPTPQIVS